MRAGQRVKLARDKLDEGGLSGTVGPEDRGVLPCLQVEAEVVKQMALATHYGRVTDIKQESDRHVQQQIQSCLR
jgi:hypothetical protein